MRSQNSVWNDSTVGTKCSGSEMNHGNVLINFGEVAAKVSLFICFNLPITFTGTGLRKESDQGWPYPAEGDQC